MNFTDTNIFYLFCLFACLYACMFVWSAHVCVCVFARVVYLCVRLCGGIESFGGLLCLCEV